VLIPYDENDPQAKPLLSTFTQALADLGWSDGRNVRMDLRWGGGDNNRSRALARELVGLQPDIIVAWGTPTTAAAQQETRTIPIVAVASEPVASGIVPGLKEPGGNATGFALFETTLAGKWLELLTEITLALAMRPRWRPRPWRGARSLLCLSLDPINAAQPGDGVGYE
jgi:putative ABC transport system substrate-binding protein